MTLEIAGTKYTA